VTPPLTRRRFAALAGGAWAAAADKPNSKIAGVQIGVQSYSYRSLPLEQAIAAMVVAGINSCELWQGHLEPQGANRDALRKWRLETPIEHFARIGARFRDAGVDLYAYNYSFRDDFTDDELARGFEMAKALGAKVITASGNVTTSARVDPFARQARMRVGWHNHSEIRKNEFARPEDFAEAMRGRSEYMCVNLDIGHFTAANFDAVDYLKKNARRIVTLHIKDRKRNQGPTLKFGEGDAPIKEVLQLLRDRKWPIPANIEYEYEGGDPVEAVKVCLAYCRAALV
jgi:sugar phosphate isomerase/epimerase